MIIIRLFTKLLILTAIFLLVACGGGGGGSSSPPGSQPPNSNDPWALIEPDYSGILTVYEITAENAPKVAFNTIEILDLLNLLVYGDELSHFFFLVENANSTVGNNSMCESGTVSIVEIVAQERFEIRYNNCVIDSIRVNGIIRSIKIPNTTSGSLILDLTMEDVLTGESQSFSGYIDLIDSEQSRFHVLISNSDGGEIWFNNFSMNVSLNGNEYGILFQGDMYISDKGKLTITTTNLGTTLGERTSTITILGTEQIVINTILQNSIEVMFGEQYIPVIIPLTSYPEGLFDGINVEPEAVISNENTTVDRNQELEFSSVNSTDQDYDFLTFIWEVVAQPVDSQASIEPTVVTKFIGDLPGFYTIRLTVEDTSGNVSQIEEVIKVLKNKPEGEINFFNNENNIGVNFSATVSLINDIYDGPFQYKIKYGPANISVDNNGQINWDGVIPDYGKNTDVNFSIYVENEDKNNVLKTLVNLRSNSAAIKKQRTDSESVRWGENLKIRRNNKDIVYFYGEQLRELYIQDSLIKTKDLFVIGPGKEGDVYFQALQDANNDGVDDYWYSSIDDKSRTYNVSWMDGVTGAENIFISFESLLNNFIYINFSDYNLDGRNELIITNTIFNTKIIDLNTRQEITSFSISNERIDKACDFNGDGFLDFIYNNKIIDAKNNLDITPVNGFIDSISLDSPNSCYLLNLNELFQVVLFEIGGDTEKVIFNEFPARSTISLLVGNFDLDSSEEIVLYGRRYNPGTPSINEAFLIDNISSNQSTVVSITSTDLNDFSELGDVKVLADLDGNGTDEFIFTNYFENELFPGRFISMSQHLSYTLQGNNFVKNYNSIAFLPTTFEIEEWLDSETLLFTTSQLGFNIVASSDLNSILTYESSYRSDLVKVNVENGETYIYWSELPNRFLIKEDLLGNEIWRVDVQNNTSFGVEEITILPNNLILIKQYQSDILIHPETGEILLTMPLRVTFSGTQNAFYETTTFDYFADMRTRSLVQIDDNYLLTQLTSSAADALLESSTHYSFIQFDEDPNQELIAYSVFNQTYQSLDLETLQFETLSDFHNGDVEFGENISSNLLQCFDWDQDCRNFITNKSNRTAFEVVDKLTGTVIWRSPKFGRIIRDIEFKKNQNSISTSMSHFSGFVFTYETP